MPEWTNEFEHASITPENKDAFNTAMGKYETIDDAVVGGFNAQKLAGKPFKMPESMDKLPDDAARGEFTSQAQKLLGIERVKDVEGLSDMNMKVGQAEGAAFDENLANSFKAFVVENAVNKADAQKMVGFYNTAMGEATKAAAAKTEGDKLDAAKACNEKLVEYYHGQDKVDNLSILLHRAIKDHMGLTAEESAEFANAMADSILTKNHVMAKGLLNIITPLVKEGSTDGGTGGAGAGEGKQLTPYEYKKARWPKSLSEWGKESDTWDTQSIQLKKQAGIK